MYSLVSAALVGCLPQSEEKYTTTVQPNVTREQEQNDEGELSEEQEEEMMRCLRKLDVRSFRNMMDYHVSSMQNCNSPATPMMDSARGTCLEFRCFSRAQSIVEAVPRYTTGHLVYKNESKNK